MTGTGQKIEHEKQFKELSSKEKTSDIMLSYHSLHLEYWWNAVKENTKWCNRIAFLLLWFWVQFSTYCLVYYYSQSVWISRLFQEKTGLFCFRKEGLRHMLKQQFSYFLLEECIRKKDRSKEHSGGSVKEGGRNGFVQPVQRFQKQAQPTTMSPSLAWVLLMLPREGEMHACCSICSFPPSTHPNYSLFALKNSGCLLLEETTLYSK